MFFRFSFLPPPSNETLNLGARLGPVLIYHGFRGARLGVVQTRKWPPPRALRPCANPSSVHGLSPKRGASQKMTGRRSRKPCANPSWLSGMSPRRAANQKITSLGFRVARPGAAHIRKSHMASRSGAVPIRKSCVSGLGSLAWAGRTSGNCRSALA